MIKINGMDDVIVGLGEVLWDVFPERKKIGGAPANFAYHVSQFGFDSRVVSAIGNDEWGNEILSNFDSKHLRYNIARVPYPTGRVQVSLDERGVPCYEFMNDVAWDNIPFTPGLKALACRTRCVCFGSLAQRREVSRATTVFWMRCRRVRGHIGCLMSIFGRIFTLGMCCVDLFPGVMC